LSTTYISDQADRPIPPEARKVETGAWAWKAFRYLLLSAFLGGAGWAVFAELRCSCVQSLVVSRLVRDMTYAPAPGPAPAAWFPKYGPYDLRLGYALLPSFTERLARHHFVVTSQARLSPGLRQFIQAGGYAIYREKMQAGLRMLGDPGGTLYEERYPKRAYKDFASIPREVADTLLYLEDRYLLDPRWPDRNPAVDWKRLPRAVFGRLAGHFVPGMKQGGASTLATQIEKFRHSEGGRTETIGDKFQQMMTGMVRAYMDGPDTTNWRRHLVTVYLNSTTLGSRPSYGEVIGLGDGLWAWYGTDFTHANRILAARTHDPILRAEKGRIYKQVLSLLLAQRRPSYYLLNDRRALEEITNTYLRLLAAAGVIDADLRDAAVRAPLAIRKDVPPLPPVSYVDRKAANAIRRELLTTLKVPSFYSLDRLDLSVGTTIDTEVQKNVAAILSRLGDRDTVKALGLVGHRLLGEADPAQVNYSVVLYERGADRNYLRVHADSLDEPFDINSGAKLILGSTAKLRTMITYLDIMADLHRRYGGQSAAALHDASAKAGDPLTRWATEWLADAPDRSLRTMLAAAMERRYSGNPHETFFTGGGAHSFRNFERSEDGMFPTVSDAFANSINLAFIRIMRDIVRYEIAHGQQAHDLLADADNPAREAYLRRFADREGQEYENRFYGDYADLSPDEAFDRLTRRMSPVPTRLAVVFRTVRPDASLAQFRDWIRSRLSRLHLDDGYTARLYDNYAIDKFSLQDRGYLAGVHPLELWMVAYLQRHPNASRSEVMQASAAARQESYAWLLKTRNRHKQDVRIRILLEVDAFTRILQDWQKVGYPFGHMVPSLASALGSSGDRPDALAQLMGIILNGGVRLPTTRIDELHFASATPYDTVFTYAPPAPRRVLAPEIAATVRDALMGVVGNGTAERLRNVYHDRAGNPVPVGGKTGTGDNRFEQFGRGGQVISSRPVDRTATFVFFIGDRFFGTVTAYVRGVEAGNYHFTSALAVQLLKALEPALEPLIDRPKS
jgi:membrane peptidoglycan carboxypeptidase